jgi:hypothetical protein
MLPAAPVTVTRRGDGERREGSRCRERVERRDINKDFYYRFLRILGFIRVIRDLYLIDF